MTPLQKGTVLTERQYAEYLEMYGNEFRVGMGAEAVRELLRDVDVTALAKELREELQTASGQKKTRIIKRLEVVESFRKSGNKVEWMILDVIPVIPPDIRPLIQLDGGRFACSDLNELYRRVIARNNRLKKLLEIRTPEIVVRNEKRMLQEAVDALIDNGRRGKPVTGASSRPLKSLSEMLRGKQGRFRQNLLGKRVDYSGRSVIVVGPTLKIYQCGLPREMALELFKPFVIKRLVEMQKCTNVKDAQKKIERVHQYPEVWDCLENVIKEHPVLLNRAPTLHRLSIQAFEPVLVDGRAIKLHPLVCTAFNADFDGDQMPVHVPLSAEAQAEASFLLLSANNLLKPCDGRAVTVPSQDMVLGSYYLTMEKDGEPGEGRFFRNFDEAMMAYSCGQLGIHAKIKVRVEREVNGVMYSRIIDATLGRLIFNNSLPQDLGFVERNEDNILDLEIAFVTGKKQLGQIIDRCIKYHGFPVTAGVLDHIKEMGYKYSTRASFSISVYDMVVPPEKKGILAEAEKQVEEISEHFMMGELSEEERYKAVVAIWDKTTNDVTGKLQNTLSSYNPIKIMSDSGARGSMAQMRQLAGMRGLMFSATGKTMEIPIKSNFREGMKIFEYFMGAKSSRKSLSDTALRTADSGYLTRRLVDVAQDVIVREEKCDTTKGAWVSAILNEEGNVIEPLKDRLVGRYTMGPVVDPKSGEVIVDDDVMLDEETVNKIISLGIDKVYIRTLIQCHAKLGVCAHCYGADLASGKLVSVGESVGIIAAQSIGEPGTQLTMRTFHSGGIAGSDITQGLPRVEELFEARTPKKTAIMAETAGTVHLRLNEATHTTEILIHTDDGETEKYPIPYGWAITVAEGDRVELGHALTKGSKSPADIKRIQGLDAVYDYVVRETQSVYRSQSVDINDKHVEIIARQMTRKIRVDNPGDTELLMGSLIDVREFEEANNAVAERAVEEGKTLALAEGTRELLGITKAALQTESFLSAASFQETTKVLTDAAIRGKVDNLVGIKENVIIGKLIPAGTGMEKYRSIEVDRADEEPAYAIEAAE